MNKENILMQTPSKKYWHHILLVGCSMFLGAALANCASTQQTADLNAAPMPKGGHFTGVWYSPQYGELHMIQTGQNVIGEYKKEDRLGRIQGTAEGNLLKFYWTESKELVVGHPNITRGKGYFRYKIVPEGDHYLLGEWGLENSYTGGGPWNAVRSKSVKPELSFMKNQSMKNQNTQKQGTQKQTPEKTPATSSAESENEENE